MVALFGTKRPERPRRFALREREGERGKLDFQRLRGLTRSGGQGALIRLLMLFGGVLLVISWLRR
ncbi:MAG: hypothetical protein V1800_07625 [Candidatus Latescibacterota bacterium]